MNSILMAVAAAPLGSGFSPASSSVRPAASLASYLDSLSGASAVAVPAAPPAADSTSEPFPLTHAPLSYFDPSRLASKGPRATFDWGTPQDWSRKLADDGTLRGGSWLCTEGGWPSPNGKGATEVFYVLEGRGALGDADGRMHHFGPGDTVIIPKGHTGRWDVNSKIHKIWSVNAHPNTEESGPVIRVRVSGYMDSAPERLDDTSARDPLYGSTGSVASRSAAFYDVGPTRVGYWSCQPGTFEVSAGERQWFLVLEGVMFVTDAADGTSKRCVAGDTVMLPAEWSGYVDVVEPVRKVFTVAK